MEEVAYTYYCCCHFQEKLAETIIKEKDTKLRVTVYLDQNHFYANDYSQPKIS
jgi:hypothetical protein